MTDDPRPIDPLIVDLRARRKAAGLSQEALAQALGASLQYMGRLERGLHDPALSLLRRWMQALGRQPTTEPVAYDGSGGGFWVKESSSAPWREVGKAEYVALERLAGFHNTTGQLDEPATSSFHGKHGVRGSTFRPHDAVARTLDVAEQTAAMAREAGR